MSIKVTLDQVKSTRAMILELGNFLINGKIDGYEKIDCKVIHRFSDGVYLREIMMPAGARVVGKIHTTEHLNIIISGYATVITAEDQFEVYPGFVFNSLSGTQKVVIVHEDCVWQTVHATKETDVKKIESSLTVESYSSLKSDGLSEKYRINAL